MFVLRQALAALGFCGGVHLFARVRVCLLVIGFVIYWLILAAIKIHTVNQFAAYFPMGSGWAQKVCDPSTACHRGGLFYLGLPKYVITREHYKRHSGRFGNNGLIGCLVL